MEDKKIINRVLENYVLTGNGSDDEVKVTCLPANKTSYIEQIGGDGRIILLEEYRFSEKVIWASYSARSGTVYLSPKS
ncbi:MAG: hypothetical protein U0V02_15950 [Anaerolineales bacterium]